MMNTDQVSPLAGGRWLQEIPSPTSPFTMSFPSNAFDDVDGFFGHFQDDRNTDFDNPYTGPLDYSDLLNPDDGGPTGPTNAWTHSDIQESEHFLAGMSPADGNVVKLHNDNTLEDIVSGPSEEDAHNNGRSAPSTGVHHSQDPAAIQPDDTKDNAELDSDTVNDAQQEILDEQHGQPALPQPNSSQPNPSVSQEGSHSMNIDAYDLGSWNAIDTSVQEQSDFNRQSGHTVQYRSGSLPPDNTPGHNFHHANSDPLNLSSWDALSDPAHGSTFSDGPDRQNVKLEPVSIQSDYDPQGTNQNLRNLSNQEFGGFASDDDNAHSLISSDFSSNRSSQPVQRTRRYSSPASSRHYFRHGSPPNFLHRQQQQHRRAGSNLRHEIMAGQSEAFIHNTPSDLFQGHEDTLSDPSLMMASPLRLQRQQQLVASNDVELQQLEDHASHEYVMKRYFAEPPGRVYDFRGHSPASNVQLPQHNLGTSPGSGRGNHNDMTPNVFQSPRQPKPHLAQNVAQNLALHHLSPLPSNYVRPSQRGLNNTMKKENSSPESASAALRKVKRESQHAAGRRGSQDSGSQSSTADADDEQLINAMYNAMMDMTRHQDNAGMIKTWKSLMKETNRVKKVCTTVLKTCYELEQNGGPLQTAIKTQNTYDSINHRVHELCNAFKSQKTMCKHLMEAPYLHQVVDDPIQAANRVVNNRKVNKGKKQAIEAGREALKLATNGDTIVDDAEIEDDDADGDDDEDYGHAMIQSSLSPSGGRVITAHKRARPSYAPKVGSEDSNDPSYEEPGTKKAKRPLNSRYQVNERGEMVDLGVSPRVRRAQITPQSNQRQRSSSARPQVAVPTGYPMGIDSRINAGHTARDEPTTRHGQGGYVEPGSLGSEFAGGFPNTHSGGGQQRRR